MNALLKKYSHELILLGIIAGVTLLFYFIGDSFGVFFNREALERKVSEFGFWGPVVLAIVSFFDTLIAPFPGGVSAAVGGFLYGKFWGILIVYIGNVFGANVTFWIARIWGSRFFLLFIKASKIKEFQEMVNRRQTFFWVAYFIPFLPYDYLNITIGLSDIPWKKFLLINSIGMLVSLSLLVLFGISILELLF